MTSYLNIITSFIKSSNRPLTQTYFKFQLSENDLSSVGRQSNKDAADCWICYDSKPDQELINPCMCKGDVAFVHHECLRRWLSEENKKCSVCNFEYEITRDIMDFDSALKNIHWALVVPSFVLILFIPYGTYLICCQAEKHAALDKHRTLIQSSAVIICLLIGTLIILFLIQASAF